MRYTGFAFFSLAILFISSCERSGVAPNKDTQVLHKRFHGKYKLVSATAMEAVDLNRDGTSSTNLLSELDLENSFLEIRISNQFVLSQAWPEVYLSAGNPDSTINYANQGVTRNFEFDNAIQQLQIKQEIPMTDEVRFPMPEAVLIKSGDNIEVTINKRLYTSMGWKVIKVVTLYQRFTMIT